MKFSKLSYVATLAAGRLALGEEEEVHGEGAMGTEMGPVAFLWPSDRPWSASADNVAPCGSSSGVSNRTSFPLSQGSVALSIADEAWHVAFSIAYDDDPTSQSDFTHQVVSNITALEAGHQCYRVADIPDTVEAGANATIQLEYWSNMENELDGRNQSFYACADITFVEASNFDVQVPCFNVTSSDFKLPDSDSDSDDSASTATSTSPDAAADATSPASPAENSSGSEFGSGLSTGAKAGVAVGVIVGSIAVVGAIAFFALRRRRGAASAGAAAAGGHEEAGAAHKSMREVPSVSTLRN